MAALEELADRLRQSTVQLLHRAGGGSGIVWGAPNRILTNSHVMRTDEAHAADYSGRRFRTKVIRRDRERDLALLDADLAFEPAVIGDSANVRPGQLVFAIGNPLGIAGALSLGTIHAVGRIGFELSGSWIQADIRLAPGNSGGALADAEGRVIGINTMILNGLGLAIPSRDVEAFVAYREARAA